MLGSQSRREFLFAGGVAALAAMMAGCTKIAAPDPRPNILFLFTDDQRFSTLNAINNPAVQTPTMDRLVREGTAFTRAHIMGGTIGAVCAPSRGMMLTGQTLFHVHDNLIKPNNGPDSVARPFNLYPEELRKAGYRTFGTGKWHNGPATYARCFTDGGNIFFGGMSDHLKVPVQDFDPEGRYPKERQRIGEKFSSELFSDAAIHFLENHKGDEPFFAYVSFTAPHDPRMAPEKYTALYPPDKIEVPKNFLPEHPFDNGEMRIRDEMLAPFPRTPEVVRENIAAYYAMITEVDEQMGRVLAALEASGKAKNTIVIFAADNGLALGQHGLMGKQNLYEHSIRVPLVMAGPGIPKNEKRDALVYLYDLAPTLCEFAHVPVPATVEGKSLRPVIGENATVRDSVFYAYRDIQRGVRTDRWKLILYNVKGKNTAQLFDLENDPLEMTNLADKPEHKATIEDLRERMKAWIRETQDKVDIDQPNWGKAEA